MPLDMTGMTLTPAERAVEAKRIIDRIRKPLEQTAFRGFDERTRGFVQMLFDHQDLFPEDDLAVSPKQLLWLRDISAKVD